MNMKPFSKIRQFADKAFVRPDRTEVLSEKLLEAEKRIELIKQTCEITVKKVAGCLHQGKDVKEGIALEKRIKKVPEVIMGTSMLEYGNKLGNSTTLGEVLEEAGKIQMKVGSEMIEYDEKIERLILAPLQKVIQDDIPNIYKLKRTLSKLTENMDNARARLSQASHRHSLSSTGEKMTNYKEDVEDTQQKVEQCRDNLCAEMYQLIAREAEIAQTIVLFLKYQMDYHARISSTMNELLPEVDAILSNGNTKTVYGTELTEHLKCTQRTIAAPIEFCICGLIEIGLEEEGLFRIGGSLSKLKKLKSEFDVGLIDLHGLLADICDPHVISNALKCYLRELPQPLLTTQLYGEWLAAIRVQDNQDRLQALWKVVQQLPESNRVNLAYLIKFFKLLTTHQDVNKMSPSNLAIVIGPNLLWAPTEENSGLAAGDNSNPMDLTLTHLFSSIVDQLITYADWFFPGDTEFFVTCKKPTEEDLLALGIGTAAAATKLPNGLTMTTSTDGEDSTLVSADPSVSVKRSQSTSSLDDHSPPREGPSSPKPFRRKNKQAPVPPATPVKTSANAANLTPASVKTSESSQNQNTRMTHARHGSAGAVPLSASTSTPSALRPEKEKDTRREGFYVPPSPSQMGKNPGENNRERMKTGPPPKPPQPQPSLKEKFMAGPDPTPAPPPEKDKEISKRQSSSFRFGPIGSASGTAENENSESGSGNGPGTSSTGTGSTSLQYSVSLPRRFHTENSYKVNLGARLQAEAATAPAQNPVTSKTDEFPRSKSKTPPPLAMTKESIMEKEKDVNEKLPTGDNLSAIRPVPAPRSSLGTGATPTVKERPSLMAKPKDLTTKRTQQADGGSQALTSHNRKSSGSEGESDQHHQTDLNEMMAKKGQSEFDRNLETPSKERAPPLQSPTQGQGQGSLSSPFRPPRPNPPAPPKSKSSVPLPGESTNL